jgi:hypothetical protein
MHCMVICSGVSRLLLPAVLSNQDCAVLRTDVKLELEMMKNDVLRELGELQWYHPHSHHNLSRSRSRNIRSRNIPQGLGFTIRWTSCCCNPDRPIQKYSARAGIYHTIPIVRLIGSSRYHKEDLGSVVSTMQAQVKTDISQSQTEISQSQTEIISQSQTDTLHV